MANKDGFRSALEQLGDNFDDSSKLTEAFESELAALRQSMVYTSREVGTLASGIEGSLRRAFDGLLTDGLKLSDALKGIANSMAATAFSVAMKPVEQAISGTLANGVNSLVSAVLPFGGAAGGFAQNQVMPFADGAAMQRQGFGAMRGLIGAMAGGLASGAAPAPGPQGSFGGHAAPVPRPVNVTMNVSTPDVAGFQRSRSQIAAEMGRALSRGNRNF